MRILRHGAVLAISTIAAAVVSAGQAHADVAETVGGTGTARALHLNVLGQDLTLGATDANVGSTLKAAADAAGQLVQTGYPAKASVTTDNSSVVDPKSGSPLCQGLGLPDQIKTVLNAAIACSLAKADIKAGAPHALGQASVAQLGVSANTLLQPITDNIPLDQTLAAVKQNLGPVIDAVNKATGGQVDVNKDLKTVTDLLKALTTQQTLAVKLGDSKSELTTVANSLTSTASAQGATIEVLPVSALGGTPIATLTLGAA